MLYRAHIWAGPVVTAVLHPWDSVSAPVLVLAVPRLGDNAAYQHCLSELLHLLVNTAEDSSKE